MSTSSAWDYEQDRRRAIDAIAAAFNGMMVCCYMIITPNPRTSSKTPGQASTNTVRDLTNSSNWQETTR